MNSFQNSNRLSKPIIPFGVKLYLLYSRRVVGTTMAKDRKIIGQNATFLVENKKSLSRTPCSGQFPPVKYNFVSKCNT